MPNVEEGEKGEPEDEAREDLFEEPTIQRAIQTYAHIDAQLQAASRSISLQASQFNAALDSIGFLSRMVSEAANRLTATITEPIRQVTQLSEQIQSSMTVGIQVDLSPLLSQWRIVGSTLDLYKAAYDALVTNYLTSFQEALSRVTFSFRPLLDEISRAQARQLERILRRYHWWPVPGLPPEFYLGILDLVEQGQTRRVNRYICDWFRWNRYRRLGRMVRRWDDNEYFRCRRHIYNQALMAHRRGWYNLTVPALMPLVEGVARDYLQKEHGITERSGKVAIEEALNRNIPPSVFREELQQALIRFLTSSTFADTDHDGILPSGYELNRHGVAHSRHLRYGTEVNSLRCFLLLETLYQFIADALEISWF